MRKSLILILLCLTVCNMALGQKRHRKDSLSATSPVDTLYTDEYLDTVSVKKASTINDYSMIGVQYGAAINKVSFNPSKKTGALMSFDNVGIFYTKYGKMFGYMPYFGFQVGVMYGHDGYSFKEDKEGKIDDVDGAVKATYEFIEVPLMSHFHLDAGPYFKILANVGFFGSYRLSVQREGEAVPDEYRNSFYDYDKRFDYGLRGGAGFGLVFAPVELHISASLKYSFASLYEPDYASKYYYRYAHPLDIMINVGLHFHLSKRSGKTKGQLRKEAYNIVYPENNSENENTDVQGR